MPHTPCDVARRGFAALLVLSLALGAAGTARAQSDSGSAPADPADASAAVESVAGPDVFSSAGAQRAELLVNQVYIDRIRPEATVAGGDFASHLLERLGVRPVPDGMNLKVRVDTAAVRIHGRLSDLPPEAREMLGPVASFVDPDAPLVALVTLRRENPVLVRFRLHSLSVNGMALPEMVLAPMMAEVGRRLPALTRTGRDLLVAVPRGAGMRLIDGGIHLAAPPSAAPGT